MIDIANETVIPIADAPSYIPGHPSLATVWRWVLNGTRAGKLDSILIGGRRFTSAEAVQRFANRSTAAADGDTQPSLNSFRQRQPAVEQTDRISAIPGETQFHASSPRSSERG